MLAASAMEAFDHGVDRVGVEMWNIVMMLGVAGPLHATFAFVNSAC